MAFTFTVEDGTGLANANSYASVAEGDDYHAAHLYATDWTGATTEKKQQALAMATRLVDSEFDFIGYKMKVTQGLQWPRGLARNPDLYQGVVAVASVMALSGGYFPSDAVPAELKQAVCEMARLLIGENRTRNPDNEGVAEVDVYKAVRVKFDKTTAQPVISRVVVDMLSKIGQSKESHTRVVRLSRV